MTARRPAILPLAQWQTQDPYRPAPVKRARNLGLPLDIRAEVEDIETAIKLVGRGFGDSAVPKVLLHEQLPRLAPVRRVGADETTAARHSRRRPLARRTAGSRLMIDLAIRHLTDLVARTPDHPAYRQS